MTVFDPISYWRANGSYLAGPGAATPEHELQSERLSDVLDTLNPATILEVGCGRGRIASLLRSHYPDAKYTGLDVGPAQLEAVARVWSGCVTIESPIQDFDTVQTWDLVVASEVLMHIPPSDIEAVIAKLRSLSSGWIVTVDWTEPVDGPIAEWNWRHDYRALFGAPSRIIPVGLQSIFLVSA